MKKQLLAFTSLCVILLYACSSPTGEDSMKNMDKAEKIIGVWTLFKEEKMGKENELPTTPTAVSLEFKENGYFIYFDKITDDKISGSGVGKIQERYKGQYQIEGETLKMNHYVNDSLVKKTYHIEKLEANEMTLINKASKNIKYFKR